MSMPEQRGGEDKLTKVWTKNAKERKSALDQGEWEGGGGRGGLGGGWCLVRSEGI